MVKRKADIGLDEWLAKGVESSESRPLNGVEPREASAAEPCPTVTTFPLKGRTEPATETTVDITGSITNVTGATVDVVGTNTDVAGTGMPIVERTEEAAEWFWRILKRAGYERR